MTLTVSIAGIACALGVLVIIASVVAYLLGLAPDRWTDQGVTLGAVTFLLGVALFVCAGLVAYLQAIN